MIRKLVRTLTVLAGAACLTGTRCEGDRIVGPEGLIPAGDYRLARPTDDTMWLVPAPAPHQGCARLVDARFIIDDDGSVVHTRTLTIVQSSEDVVIQQEFRPALSAYDGSMYINLDYDGGGRDIAHLQSEPTSANPDLTALYADQFFRATAECPVRRLTLRYVKQGTTG